MYNPYPHYPEREVRNLDGFWQFAFLETDVPLSRLLPCDLTFKDWSPVPGCWDAGPRFAGKRGIGAYRRPVAAASFSRLKLKIGGLGLRARIFWDNREIGVDSLPFSQVEYDFDAGPGSLHELAVLTDNRFLPDSLFLPYYDFYAYGGIYRSVELQKLPDMDFYLDRVAVTTLNRNTGLVRLSGSLVGNAPEHCRVEVAFDGNGVKIFDVTVSDNRFRIETLVPSARLWSCETPHLHLLRLRIGGDVIEERFGIRTIVARQGKILLNGRPIRLRGINRHDSHPQFGYAMPPALLLEDLQFLHDLNCNFIRGCHYPQSQLFLDLCDQSGFLVWEESLAWGNRESLMKTEEFQRLQLEQTARMVKNSCNHPSVIIWGCMNEGEDRNSAARDFYGKLIQEIRSADDGRMVTFASTIPEQGCCYHLPDLISINAYPGWYETSDWTEIHPLHRISPCLSKIEDFFSTPEYKDKPLIISEIGAGAVFGCHDRLKAHWSEEYQADYLAEACRCVLGSKRICGMAVWHFADCRTYAAAGGVLKRPRGFNNKGILDEYRRPKLAYDTIKRLYGG